MTLLLQVGFLPTQSAIPELDNCEIFIDLERRQRDHDHVLDGLHILYRFMIMMPKAASIGGEYPIRNESHGTWHKYRSL